jgi:Trypsin-like peptidase domain
LTIDWDPEAPGRELALENGAPPVFQGREIYVVGHPYRRRHSELVVSVFGTADGMKRLSPGLVKRLDREKPLFEHDCSTLGGNSGSCVFTTDSLEVIGIHYGGSDVDDATAKGSANLAVPLSRLGTHQAAEIIRNGKR